MAVSVVTPASSEDLTTVTRVKTFLGITSSSEDALLAILITGASSLIANEFARPLVRQTYRESVIGNDRSRVCMSRRPIDEDQVTVTLDDVVITDWLVEDAGQGILWRESGWPSAFTRPGQDGEANVSFTYSGGYLLAPMVSTWTTATEYALRGWARPTSPGSLRFECTTAGTSGVSEPAWPTTAGLTVTDGTAVWTARDAREITQAIEQVTFLAVQDMRDRRGVAAFVASREIEGNSESYLATGGQSALPKAVIDWCERSRYLL